MLSLRDDLTVQTPSCFKIRPVIHRYSGKISVANIEKVLIRTDLTYNSNDLSTGELKRDIEYVLHFLDDLVSIG